MANVELSEAYINDTIRRLERGARLDKVRAGIRRLLVLISASYSFDAGTRQLVDDELEGHNSDQ